MQKLLIASLTTALFGFSVAPALCNEQFNTQIPTLTIDADYHAKLNKKLEKLLKNQEEIKKNQKEILLNAKLPREQHTHYGFLSPHPLTALIMVGVPGAAAVLIMALIKS